MQEEPISKWGEQSEYAKAAAKPEIVHKRTARAERGNGGFISANANVSEANVKRAKASGRSHNHGDKRTDEATIA